MRSRGTGSIGWKAQPGAVGRIGITATIALLVVSAVALWLVLRTPVSVMALALLVVAALSLSTAVVIAVLTYGVYRLQYQFQPGALVVQWLGRQEVLPYADIDAIYSGTRLERTYGPKLLNFRGYRVGSGWAKGAGPVYFYTTTDRLEHLAVIAANQGVFAISPVDSAAFRRELIQRIEADEQQVLPSPVAVPWRPLQSLGDPVALAAMATSILCMLAGLGFIFDRYDALPELVAIHFDLAGRPELIAHKGQLFVLPAIGALVLIANTVFGGFLALSDVTLARIVWLASPVTQALLVVSIIRVLP